jgi:hypothetical protein
MSGPPGASPGTRTPRRHTRRLGCPCGCTPDRDCVTTRPAPVVSDRCAGCGVLGFEGIRAAQLYGMNCARGCVAERLGLLEGAA